MMVQEPCFFHGAVITAADKEFVSGVQREDNFLRGLRQNESTYAL